MVKNRLVKSKTGIRLTHCIALCFASVISLSGCGVEGTIPGEENPSQSTSSASLELGASNPLAVVVPTVDVTENENTAVLSMGPITSTEGTILPEIAAATPETEEQAVITSTTEPSTPDSETDETNSIDVTGEDIDEEQSVVVLPTVELTVAAPIISQIVVSAITDSSAQITWSLDQPGTGVIEYGKTESFDLASKPENSFTYSAHLQTLKNLSPDTKYFFEIVSSNEAGRETRGGVVSFTTAEAPATPTPTPTPQPSVVPKPLTTSTGSPSEGWPDVVFDSLPLAGMFYGNYKAGLSSGNGPLSAQNAIRFRAERTGTVNAVRYNNRTLLASDINYRCEAYGKGSLFCECKDNGLDHISCGYTLGNSYHVGSGGLITIELREDDGTTNHMPGPDVLAQSESYEPAQVKSKFPTIELSKPVQVTAGQIYHMVFRNDKPPTCATRRLSVQAAANCPRDEGAIGMNGTHHASDDSTGSRFGPVLGEISGRVLYKNEKSAPWRVSPTVIAFYELRYTDDEYIGNTYTGYLNGTFTESRGGSRVIEGNIIGRQKFTVKDATREVDGLWLNYGHAFDRPSNGKNLTATLKSSNGSVVATATLTASPTCSTRARNSGGDKSSLAAKDQWLCRKWEYAELSSTVSLLEGSTYSVEFSAPAGAAYVLSTYFSVHRLPERNMWENAQAEISKNGGSAWEKWTGTYFASRDLPMVFTIKGMPRQLP